MRNKARSITDDSSLDGIFFRPYSSISTSHPHAPGHRRRVRKFLPWLCGLLICASATAEAGAITIDFEGLADSTIVSTQYPGLTFSNTIILTSGISLNEFEFPPHSGTNVVSDNGGPISIIFATPVLSFSGYFTYVEPVTVDAFDSLNNRVASAVSNYSSNDALFGDPGSSPNQFIQVAFAEGIASVTITGDPLGGSLVMDDVTFPATGVPEPNYCGLIISGIVSLRLLRRTILL